MTSNLRHYREKHNYSQNKLSELTGIPQTTISEWEKSTGDPPVSKAFLLAEVLGTTIDKLFDLKPSITNHKEQ